MEHILTQIAGRILSEGGRLLVVSADRNQLAKVSERLWSAGASSFLAHDHSDSPQPEVQPILLAPDCTAANGASCIALVDGHFRVAALAFDRTFYFFDGDQIDEARAAWRTLAKDGGSSRYYWRQDGGRWRQGP